MLRDEKEASSSRPYVVTDQGLADALLQAGMEVALQPFMPRACTIGIAAVHTGIKANTLYVWVQRLVDLGLLRVESEKPRAGRSAKLYRAAHRRAPFDVLSAETLEAALRKMARADDASLYRHLATAFSEDAERMGWLLVHSDPDELWFHAAVHLGIRLDNLQPH